MSKANSLPDDDLLPDERALLEGGTVSPAPAPAADAPAPAPAAASGTDADEEGTTAAPAPAPAADPVAAAPAPADEPAPAPDGEGSDTDLNAEPARPTYEAPAARDFSAELKAVRDDQSALTKKWSDGEITDDEYNAQRADLEDKRDSVLTAKVQAETIDTLNRQAKLQSQQQVLASIISASKAAGQIDYSEAKNATAFDKMLAAVSSDPENEGLGFAELAQKTHTALCAVRGISAAAPARSPSPAPAPAPAAGPAAAPAAPSMRNIPPTLGALPSAGTVPIHNEAATTIAGMDDPDQAEAALAAMPVSQRTELLRSTIRPGHGRH